MSAQGDALSGAVNLLANCPAFQTRCNAADATAAAAHIYLGSVNVDQSDPSNTLAPLRPLVILNILDSGFEQYAQGEGIQLGAHVGIGVQFQDNAAEAGTDGEKHLDFTNFVGDVVDWISEAVATDPAVPIDENTYYPFRHLIQLTPIHRSDLAERQADDFFICEWMFSGRV